LLTSPAVPIALVVISLAAAAVGTLAGHKAHLLDSANDYATTTLTFVFLVVGFVITLRRPRNRIGWLLLGVGVCFCFSSLGAYSVLDYRLDHGNLPLGLLGLLCNEGWAPAIVLLSATLVLFPDGRPPTRTCRAAMWAMLTTGAVWIAGAAGVAISAVVTNHVRLDAQNDLWAIDHPVGNWAWWYSIAQPAFFITLAATWLLWLVQQVGVYRRSAGDRRLQLKWLYGGAGLCALGGVLTFAWSNASSTPLRIIGAFGTALLGALPLSVGIAVTRFHLYDVDRVVSRTIAYGTVTALVIGCYAGIVTLATKAMGLSSPVAVAASTLAAAAVFNPLRRRVQRGVDRRFNRARYDAEATVTGFALRLRESIGVETVREELLSTVGQAVEPAALSLWVRSSAAPSRAAE
jgi:hypothetical protein